METWIFFSNLNFVWRFSGLEFVVVLEEVKNNLSFSFPWFLGCVVGSRELRYLV